MKSMMRAFAFLLLLVASQGMISTDAFTVVQPESYYNSLRTRKAFSSMPLWSSSPSDVDDDIMSSEATEDDDFVDGPVKSELLAAITSASGSIGDDKVVFDFVFGFGGDSGGSSSRKIPDLVKSLENKYVLPLDNNKPTKWKLLYTNAPDLLGLEGGPLSQLVSIQQTISSSDSTLTLSLIYKPSDGIVPQLAGNFLSDLPEDRLTQQVVFEYEEKAMNVFDLKLQSTSIDSTRFGSLPTLPIPSAPSIEAFKMVFNDGDLRIERTVQGDFIVIYKRMD